MLKNNKYIYTNTAENYNKKKNTNKQKIHAETIAYMHKK